MMEHAGASPEFQEFRLGKLNLGQHTFYEITQNKEAVLGIWPHKDTVTLLWCSSLSDDERLSAGCSFIDKCRQLGIDERSLNCSFKETVVGAGDEQGIAISYSGHGVNNVIIASPSSDPVTVPFAELNWPLSMPDLKNVAAKAGADRCVAAPETFPLSGLLLENSEESTIVRVNASCGSICLESKEDNLPGEICLMTHIKDLDLLYDLYRNTAIKPIPARPFKNLLAGLIQNRESSLDTSFFEG